MISVHLRSERTPRVLAVFSFRYDAHLVPALLANLDPIVGGWISYDDSSASGLFSNEVPRRTHCCTPRAKPEPGGRSRASVSPAASRRRRSLDGVSGLGMLTNSMRAECAFS